MSDKYFPDFLQSLDELAGGWDSIPDLKAEIAAIAAEAIGWIPLDQGAYLHLGTLPDPDQTMVIEVVGSISADMASLNVLLLT